MSADSRCWATGWFFLNEKFTALWCVYRTDSSQIVGPGHLNLLIVEHLIRTVRFSGDTNESLSALCVFPSNGFQSTAQYFPPQLFP
jgi:hypothetical protein